MKGMTVKLLSLRLENFQGVKDYSLSPGENNVRIYGDNATGKTTLANAFLWALCDKAYNGEPSFDPKPKDGDGKDKHNLTTAVTVVLSVDGKPIGYRRERSENWKTKRGSSVAEFSGHDNKYSINTVPVKSNEYIQSIAEIFPEGIPLDILLIPGQFNKYDRKARRSLLMDMCGDVTQEEVIASTPELAPLGKMLNKDGAEYTVDDYLKIVKSRLSEADKIRNQLPARIDEATKSRPDIGNMKESVIQKQLSDAETECGNIRMEIVAAQSSGTNAIVRAQIQQFQQEINKAKNDYLEEGRQFTEELFEAQKVLHQKKGNASEKRRIAADFRQMLDKMQQKRIDLVKEYKQIEVKRYDGGDVCPACGQKLPAEKLNEAVAAFNGRRSQKLEGLRTKIERECSKPMIAELEEAIVSAEQEEAIAVADCAMAEVECSKLQEVIKSRPQWEETEQALELFGKIEQLENSMSSTVSEGIAALENELNAAQQKANELRNKLILVTEAKKRDERIKQLTDELKKLSAEGEQLIYAKDLCELYKRTYANYVSDRINSMFDGISFRLFNTQINGGIVDDCEIMIPCDSGLVPYATANNAARINAGLALIDGICKHYDISVPVFVDNAESVSEIRSFSGQLITLVVCGADKELRVVHYG